MKIRPIITIYIMAMVCNNNIAFVTFAVLVSNTPF